MARKIPENERNHRDIVGFPRYPPIFSQDAYLLKLTDAVAAAPGSRPTSHEPSLPRFSPALLISCSPVFRLSSFIIRHSLPVPMLSVGVLHSPKDSAVRRPQDRQVQARKHGGAGRYKWCRIAMSFPPRIVVRGGNPISLVSILLRLRPQLLIKL